MRSCHLLLAGQSPWPGAQAACLWQAALAELPSLTLAWLLSTQSSWHTADDKGGQGSRGLDRKPDPGPAPPPLVLGQVGP